MLLDTLASGSPWARRRQRSSDGGTIRRKSPPSTIPQRYLMAHGPPSCGLARPASARRRTHGARTTWGRGTSQRLVGKRPCPRARTRFRSFALPPVRGRERGIANGTHSSEAPAHRHRRNHLPAGNAQPERSPSPRKQSACQCHDEAPSPSACSGLSVRVVLLGFAHPRPWARVPRTRASPLRVAVV